MWKNIHVDANGVKLSQDSRGHHPFALYTRTLTEQSNITTEDTQGAMKSALFIPDIPGAQLTEDGSAYDTDPFGKNTSMFQRYKPSASSAPFELYTPLNMVEALNFKNKQKAIPSGVTLVGVYEFLWG